MVHIQANILGVHAPSYHQERTTGLLCSGKKEGDCALLDRPRRFDVEVTEVAVFIVLVQHAFRFFLSTNAFNRSWQSRSTITPATSSGVQWGISKVPLPCSREWPDPSLAVKPFPYVTNVSPMQN